MALSQANTYLISVFGNNTDNWRWGDLHYKKLTHGFLTLTPLRYFSDRQHRSNGGRNTLDLNSYEYIDGKLDSVGGAGLRIVFSLDKNDKSYWITDTGVNNIIKIIRLTEIYLVAIILISMNYTRKDSMQKWNTDTKI